MLGQPGLWRGVIQGICESRGSLGYQQALRRALGAYHSRFFDQFSEMSGGASSSFDPLLLPPATFPATGGSISNMYAVNLARYQRYPDCKQRGLRALPPLALFTSKEVGRGSDLPWAPASNVQPAESARPDPS